MLLMTLLAETLKDAELGLSEEQMEQIMENFIQKLPQSIRLCLQPWIVAQG